MKGPFREIVRDVTHIYACRHGVSSNADHVMLGYAVKWFTNCCLCLGVVDNVA